MKQIENKDLALPIEEVGLGHGNCGYGGAWKLTLALRRIGVVEARAWWRTGMAGVRERLAQVAR